jgi:hypothetical protein
MVCRSSSKAFRPRSAPCWRCSAIAAAICISWTERELIGIGGRVGSTLYALSREPAARASVATSSNGRKPITLSTKPLSTFKPLDDELDDEDVAAAVTA